MREISSTVGVIESVITRQSAFIKTVVKPYDWQLFVKLQVVGIVVHTGGDDQPVELAGNHVIHHHALLTGGGAGT